MCIVYVHINFDNPIFLSYMFYILSYFIITAVSVYFIVSANKRIDLLNKQLRNHKAWLRAAQVAADRSDMATEAAYKCIDRLEERLHDVNASVDQLTEPCEEDAFLAGYVYDDDGELVEAQFTETMLDAMCWSPQHAGDATCFTDSNCSSAYGDEDTSDDC